MSARSAGRVRLWGLLALLLYVAGLVLLFASFVGLPDFGSPTQLVTKVVGSLMGRSPPVPGLMFVGGMTVLWCATHSHRRARRHDAPTAAEATLADARPPVLYLRSFEADRAAAGKATLTRGGILTEEEALTLAVGSLGPFIAVGRPGEALGPLGAARLTLPDAGWQEGVTQLMKRSSLVVLRAGDSPGFWWELEQAVALVPPERLVVLLPFGRAGYEDFRTKAEARTRLTLPPFQESTVVSSSIRAVLCFDERWNSRTLPLRGSAADWLVLLLPFVPLPLTSLRKEPPLTRALRRTLPALEPRAPALADEGR